MKWLKKMCLGSGSHLYLVLSTWDLKMHFVNKVNTLDKNKYLCKLLALSCSVSLHTYLMCLVSSCMFSIQKCFRHRSWKLLKLTRWTYCSRSMCTRLFTNKHTEKSTVSISYLMMKIILSPGVYIFLFRLWISPCLQNLLFLLSFQWKISTWQVEINVHYHNIMYIFFFYN